MATVESLARLDGRVALVIGGAGHIGSCIVETLDELGAWVAVADRDAEGCAAIARGTARGRGFEVDLRDEPATRALIGRVLDAWGRLDVLVHSAAYAGTTERAGWNVPFAEQTVDAWDEAMRVNLTSAFALAQEAESALRDSGHGSVILVSSIYGMVGPDLSLYEGTAMSNPTAYGASKGGLLQLTRYLATQLGPEVRVNALSPGGVARGQPAAFVERYVRRTPLRRMATEDDLRGAVAFLASDLSSYVTGQNLVVDGGFTAW